MSTSVEDLGHDQDYYILPNDDDLSQIYLSKGELSKNTDAIDKTADRLIDIAKKALLNKSPDFKMYASVAYGYTKRHFAHLDTNSSKIEESLSLLFRNKISAEYLKEMKDNNHDWYRLVMSNHMHYQILASDAPLLDGVASLSIGGKASAFSDLEKTTEDNKIIWKKEGTIQFVTDQNLKLKDHYFAGASGILPGSPSAPKPGNELSPFLKVPASNEHKVWVMTSMKQKGAICLGGDHVYLGLEDKEGNVSFFGQYSKNRKAPWYTFLQRYEVAVESPDRYAGLPLTNYYQTKREVSISEEQYNALKMDLVNDLQNENTHRRGSALTDNCAGYVASKLGKIGIDIKAKRSVGSIFFRKCLEFLPKSISKPITGFLNLLPKTFKRALYYFPIPAIPLFITGLIFKIASLFTNNKKATVDVSILDLAMKPWEFTCNHPHAVYEWQMEGDAPKRQEDLSILAPSLDLA
jgi:hypothetical protein